MRPHLTEACARRGTHASSSRPFQLEPALVVVRGRASRLLLADEVGLVKTIQAGLILAELWARGEADRALVLTPAGLRHQWAQELRNRFALEVDVLDATELARQVASLPRGLNPWTIPRIRIVSFDFIKRPEILHALQPITWDVLIADEAHLISGDSDRGMSVRALAARSRRVVLATATPHAGDDRLFQTLCATGRLAGQEPPDPIVLFRRSRASVGLPAHRRSHVLYVTLTDDERRMHVLLDQYTRRVWLEASVRKDEGAFLAITVLKKRALSSARALALTVARRLIHLSPQTDDSWQARLPLTDEEPEDAAPDRLLAAPGLASVRHERAWLGAIQTAAISASHEESKLRRLRRLLHRIGEPLIVFTEYRDTLAQLVRVLGGTRSCSVLHGGLARQAAWQQSVNSHTVARRCYSRPTRQARA